MGLKSGGGAGPGSPTVWGFAEQISHVPQPFNYHSGWRSIPRGSVPASGKHLFNHQRIGLPHFGHENSGAELCQDKALLKEHARVDKPY
jgi:hypothetical protein